MSHTAFSASGGRSRAYTRAFAAASSGSMSRIGSGSDFVVTAWCVISPNAFTLKTKWSGVRSAHSAALRSDGSA